MSKCDIQWRLLFQYQPVEFLLGVSFWTIWVCLKLGYHIPSIGQWSHFLLKWPLEGYTPFSDTPIQTSPSNMWSTSNKHSKEMLDEGMHSFPPTRSIDTTMHTTCIYKYWKPFKLSLHDEPSCKMHEVLICYKDGPARAINWVITCDNLTYLYVVFLRNLTCGCRTAVILEYKWL